MGSSTPRSIGLGEQCFSGSKEGWWVPHDIKFEASQQNDKIPQIQKRSHSTGA